MNYKKFKPELSDMEVDDLEGSRDTSKPTEDSEIEEVKGTGASKIVIMQITGKRQEMEIDLENTKVKDVISRAFKNEQTEGK